MPIAGAFIFFLTYQETKVLFVHLRAFHQSIQTDLTYSIFAVNMDSVDNTDFL